MSNNYFRFKQFTVLQERSAFRVGTDGVLLGACAEIHGSERVLDIGTGTGLIALMLAQRSDAEIVAIEPHYDSFLEASKNAGNSKWKERISVENCGLRSYYPGNGFDLIVTNPPYFIGSLKNPDPVKSGTRHNISLTHTDILEGSIRLLNEEGTLQLILPYSEGNIFIAEAAGYGLYCSSILKIKPVPSGKIIRLILSFSRKRTKPAEKFLVIETGTRHDYTQDYMNLTRDFYPGF